MLGRRQTARFIIGALLGGILAYIVSGGNVIMTVIAAIVAGYAVFRSR